MILLDSTSQLSNITDLGYDNFLNRNLFDLGQIADTPPLMQNVFTNAASPQNILSGELISEFAQKAGTLFNGKTTFDNTIAGYILGIDSSDSLAKFYIGNTTNYLNWNGTTLTVTGSLVVDSLDIPDTVTANSFHVNSTGDTWWGATTLGAAVASITSAGVATFVSGAIGGFTIGATTLTATNLTLTSGAVNVANIAVGTGANLAGLNSANAGTDIAIWAGATFANRATAPFNVTAAGGVTGTNMTGAGIFAQYIFSTIFETAGRFTTSSVGSGSSTFDNTGLTITTGATGSSYNETYPSFSGTAYDYTLRTSYFSVNASMTTQGTDRHCIFGPGLLAISGGADGITYTGKHYGFKLNRVASVSTNSATNGDGTTETATAIGGVETTRALYTAQKNGTTNIEYYVDAALVATHTTNLPAADTDTPLYTAISNIATATSSQLNFMNYTFCQTAH